MTLALGRGRGRPVVSDALDPIPVGWPGPMRSWTPAQRSRFEAALAAPAVAALGRPRDRFVEAYRAVVLMGRRRGAGAA